MTHDKKIITKTLEDYFTNLSSRLSNKKEITQLQKQHKYFKDVFKNVGPNLYRDGKNRLYITESNYQWILPLIIEKISNMELTLDESKNVKIIINQVTDLTSGKNQTITNFIKNK